MVRIVFGVLLIWISCAVSAQQIPPNINERMAKQELAKRGISEDAVRQRMQEKGFDVDNIDPNRLPAFQKALEETINELESEAAGAVQEVIRESSERAAEQAIKTEAAEEATDIRERVDEGVPLEEAISEELLDNEDPLPTAGIYGQHIFRNQSIKVFRQSDEIKAPDNYILGPGDEIVVSIWGASIAEEVHTINSNGYINPRILPRIYLKGIAFGQARELIRRRYAQGYAFGNGEFEVSLKYSRTISVNLTGEVFNPGTFSLPAINTAFNALVAGDGPNDIGSVRRIKLVRSGVQTIPIDLYEYLLNPGTSDKYYLEDGDFIFVPVAEKVVSIQGAVKRPFRYELLDEENLIQLIEYAGGLQDNAYRGNIQIRRYVDDEEMIIDLDLNRIIANNGDYLLKSGDRVVIKSIPNIVENIASIAGAVDFPDEYELTPNMRISDLIAKGVLSTRARQDIAYLIETDAAGKITYAQIDLASILGSNGSSENRLLKPKDRILILGQNNYIDTRAVTVDGAVRNPGDYTFTDSSGMRISDLITLAGGLRLDATPFAYLYRTDETSGNRLEYVRINIGSIVSNPNISENIALAPNDRLRILSKNYFTDDMSIRIGGAVRSPGEYKYDPSLSLRDVITLAGGLQLTGASNRIEIGRLILQNNEPTQTVVATVEVNDSFEVISGDGNLELQPFDIIQVRYVPDFEFQQTVTLSGEVRYPGQYVLIQDNEPLMSLITRAGGFTREAFLPGVSVFRNQDNIGYIITDVEEAERNPSSPSNLIMKNGDLITVPKTEDIVSLGGAIKSTEIYADDLLRGTKLNIAFQGKRSARWYINEFGGGFSDNAQRRAITVEHPSGKIEKTKNFGFFKFHPKVNPGSQIIVGAKPPKEERDRREPGTGSDVDWGNVVAESLAQVTAVLTLIVLLQRVN